MVIQPQEQFGVIEIVVENILFRADRIQHKLY